MKRALSLTLTFVWLCLLGRAQNLNPPTVSSTLEYPTGARITVNYQAAYWQGSRANPSPEQWPQNFHEVMGSFNTNVKLQIGPATLNPGYFEFGLAPESQETWQLVLHQGGAETARLPIVMREEPNLVDHLAILLRPGRTSQDFVFTLFFGPALTSLRWNIIGVPVQSTVKDATASPSPATNVRIPDLSEGPSLQPPANARTLNPQALPPQNSGAVRSATESNLKPRAGSGAFRQLLNRQDQSDN